jgi:acyl carrier protein
VINGYGPTENTTFSVTYRIREEFEHSIPIGRPIANSTAYIVDRRGRPAPLGVVGELWVGGEGVSRGYLNSPELTAEKFLPDPYRSYRTNRTYISKRLYKTGDLARWLPDGTIEFIGRVDHQVKIRGFRIEPGEIEHRLLRHETVKEAAVLAVRDKKGEKQLCAYIVADSEDPGAGFDVSVLREYLSRDLPDYMIPSFFIPLESIPLTANGKLDRKALPEPGHSHALLTAAYAEPGTELEKRVANAWKEVLGIDKVGIDDNFFELGGNSLNIVQLSKELTVALGRDIPTVTLFRFPKIRSFLEYLNSVQADEKKDVTNERAGTLKKGKNMMKQSMQKRRRR